MSKRKVKKRMMTECRYDLICDTMEEFLNIFHKNKICDGKNMELRKTYFHKLEKFKNSEIKVVLKVLRANDVKPAV